MLDSWVPAWVAPASVRAVTAAGVSTQPSWSLSSQAARTEAPCCSLASGTEVCENKWTPNTVVYL